MMKIIKSVCDAQRHHFSHGGKLERFKPLFDATESFFFIPGIATVSDAHVRDSLDLKRFMSFVILALMPSFFFGIYNAGYQALIVSGSDSVFFPAFIKGLQIVLPLVIVSYTVGFFWELLFAVIRKKEISEGFLVTGLLFPMTLPPTIPLWQAAVGISFGVVIGKEIFGGTGRNILNPALTGRIFLFFAYPVRMSGNSVWTVIDEKTPDAISGATPLAIAAITQPDQAIDTVLSQAGYSFTKLFMGVYPGSIGETSALACLIGALLLIITGIASYRIIAGGVLGVLSIGWLLNILAADSSMAWQSLNPCSHLVMGGFAFGIAFMATDPVTAPGTDASKWIYGFAIGALTVLIRVFNPAYPEGVMLAIIFMNLFAPLLDYFTIKQRLRKRIANV
ncbi:NADH:ubiquinone reductase (Na(+)-transporting) subunit B [Desulfococcaceae bacterium HSG9]|nr:NADH:ubiquinone reductase (Na(+)-transporting) subunit B [Desulfococcaceae bacterium HSG9]